MKNKYTSAQNIRFFFACLFFASISFEVFSPFVEDFSLSKMVALLYIGCSFMNFKGLLSVKSLGLPLFSIWTMFFLMVFSSILHLQMNRSCFDFTIFLNILMFWLLLNHHRLDPRVFQKGLIWFSVSAFIVSICYYLNIGVTIDEGRVMVFGENANSLGIKMGVASLLLLPYCLDHSPEKPLYKPWLLVMVIPMVSLSLATASRVSLLVLGMGLVLFVLLRKMKRKLMKFLWLLLGGLALWLCFQVVLKQELLMTRVERTIDEGSISGRDVIWQEYISLIKQYPALGVGFTGAEQYAIAVFQKAWSPHNVIIEVALYSGILGLIFFLIFLFGIFKDAWLYRKRKNIIGPLMTSMAILGLVLSGQALGVKLFWILAAYAISYRVITTTSIEKGVY